MSQVFGSPYFYDILDSEVHLQSMIIVTLNPSLTPGVYFGVVLGVLRSEMLISSG